MIKIRTGNIKNSEVVVPGSKSYTHRLLIASALSNGICELSNCLESEDTMLTLQALRQMGIRFEQKSDCLRVHGANGKLQHCDDTIYLGNSGTSMRLLTGIAALGQGNYRLAGIERMHERPIGDLIDALKNIGVSVRYLNKQGYPPIVVGGDEIKGRNVSIKCGISSQYLSSLLLMAPCTERGLSIHVTEGPVSKPYIDMTLDIMTRLEIEVERDEYNHFKVAGNQNYRAGKYKVEPDCSQAGYFWGAGALTGTKIKVLGTRRDSRQGDVNFTEILKKMGCSVFHEDDGIAVAGGKLDAIEVDMSEMPDMVPTLAVIAAFARGTTVIKNVAHLRAKESDRLGAVATELSKMGIDASEMESGLNIKGGRPVKAEIDTYNDHRIAMSFALTGLRVPGMVIKNEECVEKSFPNYWKVFEGMY